MFLFGFGFDEGGGDGGAWLEDADVGLLAPDGVVDALVLVAPDRQINPVGDALVCD